MVIFVGSARAPSGISRTTSPAEYEMTSPAASTVTPSRSTCSAAVAVTVFPWYVAAAAISTSPAATAVTTPSASTVATASSAEDQVIGTSISWSASQRGTAVSSLVSPSSRLRLAGSTCTLATTRTWVGSVMGAWSSPQPWTRAAANSAANAMRAVLMVFCAPLWRGALLWSRWFPPCYRLAPGGRSLRLPRTRETIHKRPGRSRRTPVREGRVGAPADVENIFYVASSQRCRSLSSGVSGRGLRRGGPAERVRSRPCRVPSSTRAG